MTYDELHQAKQAAEMAMVEASKLVWKGRCGWVREWHSEEARADYVMFSKAIDDYEDVHAAEFLTA